MISAVTLTHDAAYITDNDNLAAVLESHASISALSVNPKTSSGVNSSRDKPVDHLTLAKRCSIPADHDNSTVQRTTQHRVRTVLHPSVAWRFPTNDQMLRYPRLPHTLFGDTLLARAYIMGNKYAQVFGSSFGWSRAYPMAWKGDTHEALSLMLKRDGVPPKMVTDSSREQSSVISSKNIRRPTVT